MGVLVGGPFGKLKNLVGALIFSSWKGRNTVRSRPLSVSQPNTAAQVAQKNKFGFAMAVATGILTSWIKPMMDRFAPAISGINWWMSLNIDQVTNLGVWNWVGVKMASGSLLGAEITGFTVAAGGANAVFLWDDNSGISDALATDLAYAVVYNETQDEWSANILGAQDRTTGTITVVMANNFVAGDNCYGWLAFKRANNSKCSDSDVDNTVSA